MRYLLRTGIFIFALLATPGLVSIDAAAQPRAGENRLDQLFTDLKRESNERAARRIANQIRDQWARSGGATADLLIEWAREAASEEKYHVALDLLDQATTLYPDYVEAWNSRALVYLMMNDASRAMSDLGRVLAIEPRHFGALSGLAGILRATGRTEQALEVYQRMLEIYPMQRNAQRAIQQLTEEHNDTRL